MRILLELAAGHEPGGKSLDEDARATLKRTLETNGIASPAQVLEKIHLSGLKLEALRPEWPSSVRNGIAIATDAPSQFAGRIHACFDETMDRVTERFARHTRSVAVVISLVVATGLQLDAFELLRHTNTYAIVPENWNWGWAKLLGIALSAILFSLGAPFWYNALKAWWDCGRFWRGRNRCIANSGNRRATALFRLLRCN